MVAHKNNERKLIWEPNCDNRGEGRCCIVFLLLKDLNLRIVQDYRQCETKVAGFSLP
jgi:hypothetical protein